MFLMEAFHEFYRELLAVRKLLDGHEIDASGAHDRLVALLRRQESEARRSSGSYGLETYRRAMYAMAALGDEILLHGDGAAERQWMSHLLETTLFRSQRAGEKVFDDIEEIQSLGAAGVELAHVYLAVLGLGFQGYYSGVEQPDRAVGPHRQKLFRLAYGDVTGGRSHIAAAAYASTITDGEGGKLPHLKPWIYALVLLVILYVAAGTVLWQSFVADLDPLVKAVGTFQAQSPERKP
jgi:type VI secretion system protein ImpK